MLMGEVPNICYTVLEQVCWNRLGISMSNENQTTAIVAGETLIYQRDGQNYQLGVGTSAWYAWLQTAMTFRVRSPFGTFTIRRERAGNQRGDWYWRARSRPNCGMISPMGFASSRSPPFGILNWSFPPSRRPSACKAATPERRWSC